ncbi:MAG: putative small heat-shock protein [Proteobacteria bacterium]|nr:putative small heat-shock protein [Pseudomonadota bacterium]
MKLDELKQSFNSLWDSVADGWQRLRASAAGALTRFKPGEDARLPASTEGRWRVLQCAYGSFRRVVPLPVPVLADKAGASYRNGVLKIELPKATPGETARLTIKVD